MKHFTTRALALLLSLVLLGSCFALPGMAAQGFSDVSDRAWYAEAVSYVESRGWMKGVGGGSFAPDSPVTRAMFATVLARYAGAETDDGTTLFLDVPKNSWYTGAVTWAKHQGIVNGVGGSYFAPAVGISRQDLCTMLGRFLEKGGYELEKGSSRTFTDEEEISGYAQAAVELCASVGLINGFEDGSFRPFGISSRAQVAAILMRLDKLLGGTPIPTDPLPAQSFDAQAGEALSVSVQAPSGTLPAQTVMNVEQITDETTLSVLGARVEGTVLAALDISFQKEGQEIEPEGALQVQIDLRDFPQAQYPILVHVKDDNSLERIPGFTLTERDEVQSLSFTADSFSVYAIIDIGEASNRARLQVRFMDPGPDLLSDADDTELYSVYLTQRDIGTSSDLDDPNNLLPSIIEDPPIPTYDEDTRIFCGWAPVSVQSGETLTSIDEYQPQFVDGQHSVDKLRVTLGEYLLHNVVKEGDVYTVYAMVFNFFNVSYLDENGDATLDSIPYYSKAATQAITVDMLYTPFEQNFKFMGWQKDDGDNTVYENGETLSVNPGTTKLSANVQPGFWLSFDENPGDNNHYKGASYIPPVFCVNGQVPRADELSAAPTLAGYNFDGWYLNFTEGSQAQYDRWAGRFPFTGTISQDTNLKAKWSLKDEVPYTVILWKQNVKDSKNALDSAKTYDFAGTTTLMAAPGTAISALDLSAYQNKDGGSVTLGRDTVRLAGFKYNSTKGASSDDDAIVPAGTTVVNLYYDRELVTINFYTLQYKAASSPNYSDTSKNYYASSNGSDYYKVESDGSFYVPNSASTAPNTTKSYWVNLSGYGWTEFLYLKPGNNWGWYVYVDGDYYGVSNSDTNYTMFHTKYNKSATVYAYTRVTSVSTSSTYYVFSNGTWREVKYNSSLWSSYWYYTDNNAQISNWSTLLSNGFVHTRTTNSAASYTIYNYDWYAYGTPYTGLYEQRLTDAGYTWPRSHTWVEDNDTSHFDSIVDTFALNSDETGSAMFVHDYYGYSPYTGAEVYHYTQNPDGSFPSTPTYTVSTNIGAGMVFKSFAGFSAYRYQLKLPEGITEYQVGTAFSSDSTPLPEDTVYTTADGWTAYIPYGTYVYYDGVDLDDRYHIDATEGGIRFYYTRDSASITYMFGRFFNGNGERINAPYSGELGTQSNIFYELTLADYGPGGSNYLPSDDYVDSSRYVFEGWYEDPSCDTPFDFANKEMPLNGLTLYGKFREREYRVFIEPNLPAGEAIHWADPEQKLNYRIAYGGKISDGHAIEASSDNYALVGWYLDSACTQPFAFSQQMNNDIAEDYDQTEATEPDGSNSDAVNNRTWIDKKVTIYAKWRRTIPFANGIGVQYDAVQGSGAFADGAVLKDDELHYSDLAMAIARDGSAPLDAVNKQFLYWKLYRAKTEAEKLADPSTADELVEADQDPIYPGQRFEVRFDQAKSGSLQGGSAAPGTQARAAAHRDGDPNGVWVPYTESSIDPTQTYLIGCLYNGEIYLVMNYNQDYSAVSGNTNYYKSALSASYFGYGIKANTDSNGYITGIDNSLFQNAVMDCVKWNFEAGEEAGMWKIPAAYNPSGGNQRYLSVEYGNYIGCFPNNYNAVRSGHWVWDSNGRLYNSYPADDYEGVRYIGIQELSVDGSTIPFFKSTTDGSAETNVRLFVQRGTVKVSFYDYDGSLIKAEDIPYGSSATPPTPPYHPGFTFVGWSGDYTNVTENAVVVAEYSPGEEAWTPTDEISRNEDYLIGFRSGSAVWLLVNQKPTETGNTRYYFSGSSSYNDASNNYLSYTAKADISDSVVTGVSGHVSDLKYCTWQFSTEEGGLIKSGSEDGRYLYTLSSSSIYTDFYPASSTNVTWTWDPEHHALLSSQGRYAIYKDSGLAESITTLPTDSQIQLYHKELSFAVSFQDYDGTPIGTTQLVRQGRAAAAPADPTREHYRFIGWDEDFSEVNSNLTVTAQYVYDRPGWHLVTFKNWDGSILEELEVEDGQPAVPTVTPTRGDGSVYTFKRWDKDISSITQDMVVRACFTKIATMFYTVTLKAVYGDRYTQIPTHVFWYANNGESMSMQVDGTELTVSRYVYGESTLPSGATTTNIKSNQAVNIPSPTTFNREGYFFAGWAKLPEEDNRETLVNDNIPEEKLFLKWDEGYEWIEYVEGEPVTRTGAYLALLNEDSQGTKTWKRVTQIAADELSPYDGLFAVWEKRDFFYVVHSSDGSIDAVPYVAGEKPDLTKLVKGGYRYGGAYTAYGTEDGLKVRQSEVETAAASIYTGSARMGSSPVWSAATVDSLGQVFRTETKPAAVTKFETYGLSSSPAEFWVRANSVSASLDSFQAEKAKIYYLKEIPAGYLEDYVLYVYDAAQDNAIQYAYLISAIDDTNYANRWMRMDSADYTASIYSSLSYQINGQTGTTTVSVRKLFGESLPETAKLLVSRKIDKANLTGGAAVTVQPKINTRDGFVTLGAEMEETIPEGLKVTTNGLGAQPNGRLIQRPGTSALSPNGTELNGTAGAGTAAPDGSTSLDGDGLETLILELEESQGLYLVPLTGPQED